MSKEVEARLRARLEAKKPKPVAKPRKPKAPVVEQVDDVEPAG